METDQFFKKSFLIISLIEAGLEFQYGFFLFFGKINQHLHPESLRLWEVIRRLISLLSSNTSTDSLTLAFKPENTLERVMPSDFMFNYKAVGPETMAAG